MHPHTLTLTPPPLPLSPPPHTLTLIPPPVVGLERHKPRLQLRRLRAAAAHIRDALIMIMMITHD